MGAAVTLALSACATDALVTRAPRFPLESGGVYVSARNEATAQAVKTALENVGITLSYTAESTRLVVVPVDGKAQLGFDTGSCGALRNRHWDVYSAVPETATRQRTTFQEGAFSNSEAKTFALGGLVLAIKAKAYDRECSAHPVSAYDQMARELARFMPPKLGSTSPNGGSRERPEARRLSAIASLAGQAGSTR